MSEPENRVHLELGIYRKGKVAGSMRFDSATALVEIEGALYPADLATMNALIAVLQQHKDRWHPAKDSVTP